VHLDQNRLRSGIDIHLVVVGHVMYIAATLVALMAEARRSVLRNAPLLKSGSAGEAAVAVAAAAVVVQRRNVALLAVVELWAPRRSSGARN
jgi:hypothetical protein